MGMGFPAFEMKKSRKKQENYAEISIAEKEI